MINEDIEIEYFGFDDGADYVYQQVQSGIPFSYVQFPPREGWISYAKERYGEDSFLSFFGSTESADRIKEKLEAYQLGASEGAAYTINVTFGNRSAGW